MPQTAAGKAGFAKPAEKQGDINLPIATAFWGSSDKLPVAN